MPLREMKRYIRVPDAMFAPAPSEDAVPRPEGLMLAGSRPEIKNFSFLDESGATGMNTKVPQTFANGTGRRLMVTVDNWGVGWDPDFSTAGPPPTGSQRDNPNVNDVTWEHAFSEMNGSAFYRTYWAHIYHVDGTVEELEPWTYTSVTIEGGAFAVGAVDLGVASRAPGTRLMEHAYVSCAPGDLFWRHNANLAPTRTESVTLSNGEPSKVLQMFAGGTNGATVGGAWASSIRHIDAPPAQLLHPVCVNTDSLGAGDYVWRKFLRDNSIPHVHLGRGTESMHEYLLDGGRSTYRRRLAALGGFTRGIVQYGTNDLALNSPTQTLTLFQTRIQSMIALQKTAGAGEVIVGTLPPNTKSTDGYVTLANQTLDMATNGRGKNQQLLLDYNAWLRSGSTYGAVSPQAWHHGSGFYVADTGGANTIMDASPTDTPSTIAKWRVDSGRRTGDGLHPSASLAQDEATAAIPLQFFQQSTGA